MKVPLTHRNYSIRCHLDRRNDSRNDLDADDDTIRRDPDTEHHNIHTTDGRDVKYYRDRPSAGAWPTVHGYMPDARTKISANITTLRCNFIYRNLKTFTLLLTFKLSVHRSQ